MKKVFFLVLAIGITVPAIPQKGKVTAASSYIDQGMLDKAKEAIDLASANESTMNWFNTWFVKGKLCQASFESQDSKYQALYADPLDEAYAAFEKAVQLDPKGSVKKKIITGMLYNSLAVDLYNQGSTKFASKDYEGALKSFKTQIIVTESDRYVGRADTGMYYNAALAAKNAGKHQEAIAFFRKCSEMGYLGLQPYFDMSASYIESGDTAKGETILKDLVSKHPDNKDVYLQLIDLYIRSNRNDEALKYLDVAKAADPGNYILFYASGIIYLNRNNFDEAIRDLSKSIELKPEYYEGQFGLGSAYINKAVEMNKKADEIIDVKKYNDAVDQINAVYEKAIPFMEKASSLKPDDTYTLSRLQELYYRLKIKNPELNQKYLDVRAKLNGIEKKGN
jgi:tetratricopeptide (TPR) repeat protein